MSGTTRDLVKRAMPHNAVSTTMRILRSISSFSLRLRLEPRRQIRRDLSLWLVVCILLWVAVQGDNDVGVSTMRRNLRQLPIQLIDGQSTAVQQEVRELRIFGTDGRQQVSDPSTYPYSAVGLLSWSDTMCTATLVASNIILAAAECVLDSNGKLRDSSEGSSRFTLAQAAENQTASVTRVHKQSEFWTKWTHNTYVLIELDVDLGITNGALHLPTANSFAVDGPMMVQLVGYESNGEAGESFQICKIHFPSEFDGLEYMLHHDCDVSAKRSPGSPMLIRSTNLDTYIIGIHTNAIGDDPIEDKITESYTTYNNTVANRGVLGSFVQLHLSYLVQQAKSSASIDALTSLESSSSSFLSDSASNSNSRNQGQEEQTDAGASAALTPSSASSSSTESSVTSAQFSIAATAAYSCIGAVCASWLAIIFVAARRIRSNR